MMGRVAPASLTRETLREELASFLQESLRPELSQVVDGLRDLVQSEIPSCLDKTLEAWVARDLARPTRPEKHVVKEPFLQKAAGLLDQPLEGAPSRVASAPSASWLLPARFAKRNSLQIGDGTNVRGSCRSRASRDAAGTMGAAPARNSVLGHKFLRNPAGTAHRDRIAERLESGGGGANDEESLRHSINAMMESQDDYGWMSRHRMFYEDPLLDVAEKVSCLVEHNQEGLSARTARGPFARWSTAIGWLRRHEDSYRQLRQAQDSLRRDPAPDDEPVLLDRSESRTRGLENAEGPVLTRQGTVEPVNFRAGNDAFRSPQKHHTGVLLMASAESGTNCSEPEAASQGETTARSTGKLDYRTSMASPGRRTRRLSDDISHQIYGSSGDFERTTFGGCLYLNLATVVVSPKFAYVVSVLILFNAMLVGIKTDYCARHWTSVPPASVTFMERLLCLCFVIEIMVRLYVFRIDFFVMSGRATNIFDLMVVGVQVMDELGVTEYMHRKTHAQDHLWFNWKSLPLVRIMRLVRLVRVASLLHLLTELRMLIISISDSMKSVVWVLFLLFLIMYVIGVYFTQVVTIYKVTYVRDRRLADGISAQLESNFGNLMRTMLSLFETIASGVSWREVADPLWQHCSPWMLLFYLCYVFFTMFVVLNVVTGVFVSSATEKANEDRKKILMFQLRELFRDADVDKTGCMSWTKFLGQLQDPKMQQYLKAIDLHEEEALDLFHLLDTDDSDEIDEHEFVNGCLRLHGFAKAIDLATFMFDYKSWTHMWSEHAYRVEAKLDDLCQLLPGEGYAEPDIG